MTDISNAIIISPLDETHSLINKNNIMLQNNDEGLCSAPPDYLENLAKLPTTKKYIGCKIIAAEPMTQEEFLKSKGKWQENQETYGEGYKVKYPDGYESWSPKSVFEQSYREVSTEEYRLINSR